jgi:hypothetical protein
MHSWVKTRMENAGWIAPEGRQDWRGARGSCCRHYLSYRSRAGGPIVLKMRSRRSHRSADGYVATVSPATWSLDPPHRIPGSGCRRKLAMTPAKHKENCEWAS